MRSDWRIFVCLLLPSLFLTGCREATPGYYQGYVEGEYVYLASSEAGRLQQLPVSKGQTVSAGEILFEIDPEPQSLRVEEAEQRLAQARARLEDISTGSRPSELAAMEAALEAARAAQELARRDYQRREALHEDGGSDVISTEELDRFKTDVAVREQQIRRMEAELETARLGGRTGQVEAARSEWLAVDVSRQELEWHLNQKSVVAPAGGIIQDTLYRPGEYVPAGRPVISLLPPENIKVRFFIPESVLPNVRMDDTIQVQLDGMDGPIGARVSYVSPTAEFTPPVIYSRETRSKLVFMIEAIPDADRVARLHPGQPLEVHLN